MRVVLSNLFDNAVTYSDLGGSGRRSVECVRYGFEFEGRKFRLPT